MIARVVPGIEAPIQDSTIAAVRGGILGKRAIVIAEGAMKTKIAALLLHLLGLLAPLDLRRSLANFTGSIFPTMTAGPSTP